MPPERVDVLVDPSAEDARTLVVAVVVLLVDLQNGHGNLANVAKLLHDQVLVDATSVLLRFLGKERNKSITYMHLFVSFRPENYSTLYKLINNGEGFYSIPP